MTVTASRDRTSESRAGQAVYVISVAAQRAGVHPQTLRFYERRGLISPERTRGGNRRFSDADIERLRRIQRLTAEGMSLAAVERFFEMEERLRAAHAEITRLRLSAAARALPAAD